MTIDYEDFEYPLEQSDALAYASTLLSECYGIGKTPAFEIITEFDLLETIFADKQDEFREYFREDAEEWNKTATLDELEYEEFCAANGLKSRR